MEIDLSAPRQVVYQSFENGPGLCPRCDGRLEQSRQSYSVATRRGRRLMDSFIVGSDFGWYCDSCSVVVINLRQVGELLGHSMPHWDVGNEVTVEGIVDIDSIPANKQHLPIGHDDNPVPLIKFQQPRAASQRPTLNKKQRQQRQKLLAKKLKENPGNRQKSA